MSRLIRRLIAPDLVLTPAALEALGQTILDMTTADTVSINIEHIARGISRVVRNQVRSNHDESKIELTMNTRFGQRSGVYLMSDRIDEASLRAAVTYVERIAKEQAGDPLAVITPDRPRHYLSATVWHESTVTALTETRHTVLPQLINPMRDAGLVGSAFVGVMARSVLHVNKNGGKVSGHETDAEVTVVGWTPDGTGSGWAGQAARDWTMLDPSQVVQQAVHLTQRDVNPMAVEPGRMTVIFAPSAVAHFAHAMAYAWDAVNTIQYKETPFADLETGEPKFGKRVFDERINIDADPSDPEGGYLPFQSLAPLVPMQFVANGILTHLAFDPYFAVQCGVSPSNAVPFSMRMSGGPTTIDEMIASCDRGVYVNRVGSVQVVDQKTGVMSGVTNGGCFLIEHGKITKPIKNLRFIDSPFLFLNNLVAIGMPHRAAFGYAPWAGDWPIPPAIVPPIMVRDFNFTRLADAV